MNLSTRLFLGFFVVVAVGVYFFLQIAFDVLKPAARNSTEDVLVEISNMLAAIVTEEVRAGRISEGSFARSMRQFAGRDFEATIWGVIRGKPDSRVYITDDQGIVIFDTDQQDVGKDFSQWRDVHLTLRGQYGARSTRMDPKDELSTVMHVAAPITDGDRIIGVLTVAKPNLSVQPFLERGRRVLLKGGLFLLVVSLVVGLALSVWFTRSLRSLALYAGEVSQGKRAVLPRVSGRELKALGGAMETMRTKLEGKDYVERYVHNLTHELKSPLAAVQGATELLHEDMSPAERTKFLSNIRDETDRMQLIVGKMLDLAVVEHRQSLQHVEPVNLHELLQELVMRQKELVTARGLTIDQDISPSMVVQGERFLLHQAFSNLLDNALAFTSDGGHLTIKGVADHEGVQVTIRDTGPGIPDYAADRLFERFYSLPRPVTGKKGTGLGLSFAQEVAQLHGGSITLATHPQGGAIATFRLSLQP